MPIIQDYLVGINKLFQIYSQLLILKVLIQKYTGAFKRNEIIITDKIIFLKYFVNFKQMGKNQFLPHS